MIKKILSHIILCFSLIYPATLHGQENSVRFNRIDIDQGLSQNMIRDILQDSRGFMWFATWDGLNRYDGYNFKIYKNIENESTSLRINKITTLFEDHNGVIWVGTFGGGIGIFNRVTETFTNLLHDPANPGSIGDNQILRIFEDSKNRIWVGTRNGGVALVVNDIDKLENYKNIKFINFKNDPQNPFSISANGVMTIFEDSFGSIWFSTTDGLLNKLVEIDNSSHKFRIVRFDPKLRPSADKMNFSFEFIIEDKSHPGLLWLVNYYSGIMWFDTQAGKFILKYPYYNFSSDFPVSVIESLMLDKEGVYWCGTYGSGIYTFEPNQKKNDPSESIEHFGFSTTDPGGIDAPNITNLYQDKSGLIWVGTNTNGLYTLPREAKKFKSYRHNSFNQNSLIGDNVLSVLETNDGNLWIGTEIGLDKYNPKNRKYIHYLNDPKDKLTISADVVYSLHQDLHGVLWIGTSSGLDKYDHVNDAFLHYKNDPSDSNSINQGEIIKLFTDSKGYLWVGSWNGGLNKFIPGTHSKPDYFLHYTFDKNNPTSISDNRIMSIAEDRKGQLWIGTSDGGLNRMISDYTVNKDGSVVPPKFERFKHDPEDPYSISNNDVRAIFVDKRNELWLGTFGGGLNKLITGENGIKKNKFIHFRQSDGLANDVVRSILDDDEGNLWIGTAHGLSKFIISDSSFWNLYESDGLQTDKFEDVSYKNKKDGTLYFGGLGGVIAFQPQDVEINSFVPGIMITSLKRYNNSHGENTLTVEKGISEKNEITLSYNDNILTFEFAALSYNNSYKNTYAYKLEGYSNNWIQLGTKRDVTFTNLDPGKYTLFVRGSNNDGNWNLEGTHLNIIINPPWWKTKWAYSGYIFLFLLGIFISDRIMRKRITSKERDRSKLREAELIKKQAEELETVDKLVKVINRAEDLENLFNSLLKQTTKFIPKAEKAAVFLLNRNDKLFRVDYTAGYKVRDLERLSFSFEELKKRYMENSDEVEKGIFIIRNTENLFGNEKMAQFTKPLSMLIMAVERDNVLEAFVVYDNFKDKNAFDKSDARILNRFREHAISAISKAQSIKALHEKNEEIIKTQEQLVTQEKLASLGALTAGIAHEIKNPLNFVNNFAKLSNEMLEELAEEIESEKKNISVEKFENLTELIGYLKLNFKKIDNHGSRADNIIKGMLLHSRGKSGEKTPTNLNSLLDQYLNLAYHGLRAHDKEFNISIEKEYDESIGKINVIPQNISRVFLNIINNACYAANEKKRKNGMDFSPLLRVATKNFKEKVEISIKDNGEGIPDSVKENLFNPFFSTKPTGEGTGLGLSLSYDIIVKEHGGEIKFNTMEGEYTEFIITLPKE